MANVKLTWNRAACYEGISRYAIFQDDVFAYNAIGDVDTYTVQDLVPGINYCFYIKGVSNNGRVTEKSNTECITIIGGAAQNLNFNLNAYL